MADEPHPWCPICGRNLVGDACPPCDAVFVGYDPDSDRQHADDCPIHNGEPCHCIDPHDFDRDLLGLPRVPRACQACGNPPPLIRFGKTWLCAPCTDYSGEGEKWAKVVAESWAKEKPEKSS